MSFRQLRVVRPSRPLLSGKGFLKQRRGAVLYLAAVCLIVLLAFAAFTIDIGYVSLTKSELQNAADAAAMGAAWQLLEGKTRQDVDLGVRLAEDEAVRVAAANSVAGIAPVVDVAGGDVVFGRLNASGELIPGSDPALFNAVAVRVRRSREHNGALRLFFAPLIGTDQIDLSARAVAGFRDGVVGFRRKGRLATSLVPLTVHIDSWIRLSENGGPDDWSYDEATSVVRPGADGVAELALFAGRLLRPGNFGTLNIGPENLSNVDLVRQIREGVSADDLAYYGGELRLDPVTRSLPLAGDVGLDATVLSAAEEVIGRPLTIPLFDDVSGTGSKAEYNIVGFAGARIVFVRFGRDSGIVIQPAVIIDETAIADGNGSTSWNLYEPVVLSH